jgi:hypothetical protein
MFHDLPANASAAAIKRRQVKFVRELIQAMKVQIVSDIDAGLIPEDWNGIELRELIALRASESSHIMREKHNRKRYREFRRVVLNNNL